VFDSVVVVDEVDRAWQRLRGAQIAGCDDAGLRELGVLLARVRGVLDVVDGALTRRAEELAAAGAGIDGRLFQRWHGARSDRGARQAVDRASVLGAVPELEAGVAAGEVGAAHADAVARAVAQVAPEVRGELFGAGAWLAGQARRSSPEELERSVRREAERLAELDSSDRLARQRERSGVRRWVDRDGMHQLRGEFDPERGARLWAALDAAIETVFHRAHPDEPGGRAPSGGRRHEQFGADALVELCTRTGAGGSQGAELVVLIDETSLRAGLEHAGTICETGSGVPLPVATIRKLLCEAVVYPLVLGGDGQVLDHGAGRRLASREQRRALRAMYRTCAWPGCTVRFANCHVHHTAPFAWNERTNLDELVPVCSHHHHQIHDLGWRLALDHERTVTLHAPDGRILERHPFTPAGRAAPGRAAPGRAAPGRAAPMARPAPVTAGRAPSPTCRE
jgi:YD repeat-containing protein